MKHILITLIGLSIGATAGVFAADEAAPAVTPQADEAFAQLSPEDQEVVKFSIRGFYALKEIADAAEKVADAKDTAAIDNLCKKAEAMLSLKDEAEKAMRTLRTPPSEAAAQYLKAYFTNQGDHPEKIALKFITEFSRIAEADFFGSEILRAAINKICNGLEETEGTNAEGGQSE